MNSPDPHDNPYEPPSAPVADIEDPSSRKRPWLINVAVACIVIAVVIAMVVTALILRRSGSFGHLLPYVLAATVVVLVAGFFVYKIWSGRNWARIVFLLAILYGFAQDSAQQWLAVLKGAIPYAGFFILRSSLLVAALVILFLTPARHWFSKKARAK